MSHYYNINGELVFEVPNKSKPGEFRKTTIKDVRKMGLYPSVTTKNNIIRNEGLEDWKDLNKRTAAFDIIKELKQSIEDEISKEGNIQNLKLKIANITNGYLMNDRSFFTKKMRSLSEQISNEATDYGTYVHENIENMLTRKEYKKDWYIEPVNKFLNSLNIKSYKTEKVTVNTNMGYAGMVDFQYTNKSGEFGIIDWKTKTTSPSKKITNIKQYLRQIAAYSASVYGENILYDESFCAYICYISSNQEGRFEAHKIHKDELIKSFHMFSKVNDLWNFENNYTTPIIN